jgi:hypothetical protein
MLCLTPASIRLAMTRRYSDTTEERVQVVQDEQNGSWWVAKDVCEILATDPSQVRRLDDEKGPRTIRTGPPPKKLIHPQC